MNSVDKHNIEKNARAAVSVLIDQLEYDSVITGEQARIIDSKYIISVVDSDGIFGRLKFLLFGRKESCYRFIVSSISENNYVCK